MAASVGMTQEQVKERILYFLKRGDIYNALEAAKDLNPKRS